MKILARIFSSLVDVVVLLIERSIVLTASCVGFVAYVAEVGYHGGREIAAEWISNSIEDPDG